MITLKVLARLLDYPDTGLWTHSDELITALNNEADLPASQRQQLVVFIRKLCQQTLLDAQAEYSELFDRTRATSLLLFEHVYAESRDRGQAMVDLLAQYAAAGLNLSRRELPDYLPVYLEYLSGQDPATIHQGLTNITPILALLAARLQQRQSPYALLPELLLTLAGVSINRQQLHAQVAHESRDDTPEALDALWQEEQVRFQASTCQSAQEIAHQQRFTGKVTAQYLNMDTQPLARGKHQ